jgi:hypothetical protein
MKPNEPPQSDILTRFLMRIFRRNKRNSGSQFNQTSLLLTAKINPDEQRATATGKLSNPFRAAARAFPKFENKGTNKMTKQKEIWHYTVGLRLIEIIESKVIKPATANVPRGEKPVVWFSSNPVWEMTCNKGFQDKATGLIRTLTKEETAYYGNGLVRIKVNSNVAPYNFQVFKKLSNISNRIARVLENVAEQQSANPREWYVSFKPVPQSEWLDIELWDGINWNSILENQKLDS